MKLNLLLIKEGFNIKTYGKRHKIPIRIIYGFIAVVLPFIPIVAIPLIPETVYINKWLLE